MSCRRLAGLLLLASELSLSHAAPGQDLFRGGRLRGEIGVGFDGLWSASPVVEALAERTYEEWAQIGLDGAVFDTRLANYSVTVNPIWRQRSLNGFPDASDAGHGNRLNFIGNVTAFSEAAIKLSLNALRFSGTELDPFGVRRDGSQRILQAAASYPNRFFNFTGVNFEQRSTEGSRRQFGVTSTEERGTLRTLNLTAENRKTRLELERISFDDRAFGRDVNSHQALLYHRIQWGKGSRLRSSFTYFDRGGASRLNWSQSTHLQHSRMVSSDYGYQLYGHAGRSNANTGWQWDAAERFLPVARLNLGIEGSGRGNSFEVSSERWYEARARADFSASLPLGMELRGGGSVGNIWFSRTTTEHGRIAVFGERHIIDGSGRFMLENAFADPATVEITNRAGGVLFSSGFDYTLATRGGLVEVFVMPAGRMAVGDTVLVDYSFETLPGGNDRFRTYTAGASMQMRVVTVSHYESVRRDAGAGLGAATGMMANWDEQRTELDVNLGTRMGFLRISGQRLRTRNDFLNVTDYVLHGTFNFALKAGVSGALAFNSNARRDEIRPFETVSGDASVRWTSNRWIRMDARFGAWSLARRDDVDQSSLVAGIGAESLLRSVKIRLRYDRLAFSELIDRTEDRVSFDIARRF